MTASTPFAAIVGLDWEDQKHAVFLWPAEAAAAERGQVAQTPEAIAAWATGLRERFGGRPVAICLEQSRGALVYALMQYDFLVLHPINPKQLSDYRAAVCPSGAKSDPDDAELLARFLRDHQDKVRAWRPEDPITRGLRLMTEQRRKWVQDRVALTNELLQRLKESYPVALSLGGLALESEQVLAFLKRFPSQRELQRASPRQLARWLLKPRRAPDDPPAEELLRRRIEAIRRAPPNTTDAPVLDHARLAVRHLVGLLESLNRAIAECEQKIDELFARHPDRQLFASFPGAGKALAPRLAAAFGTHRDKFGDAQELQRFSGIAPVTRASGKTRSVQMRWACPKFLRQTFHEFARCSIRYSRWAQAYVDLRKARGDRHQEIVRGLAFKWQRILFRCWQNREAYDEDRYLQRLLAAGTKLTFAPKPLPST